MKVRKIPSDKLFAQNSVMSEDQIEGVLLGWFYRVTQTCDRRPNEMLQVETSSGLPGSASNLTPRHRAVYGTELAMGLRYYNKDPEALLRTRRQLAEQILLLTSSR